MLRMESETGWWLITHPDHARLAADFAAAWGNVQFRKPEPNERVIRAIACHDDGWTVRDTHPSVTRQGSPSAFSIDLVGKKFAFAGLDLEDHLAIRDQAVRLISEQEPYAGLLVSMHTSNLLNEHTDRSTIPPEELVLLNGFLACQRAHQAELRGQILADPTLTAHEKSDQTILEHLRLLEACDNLSLLTCVAFMSPAHLLHPLPLNNGDNSEVLVAPIGQRHFRLAPWPFPDPEMTFAFPARHVEGKAFPSSQALSDAFHAAPSEQLTVTLTSQGSSPGVPHAYAFGDRET
jgi:hypothetical protein